MSFQHIENSASIITFRGGSAFCHQLFIVGNQSLAKCKVPQLHNINPLRGKDTSKYFILANARCLYSSKGESLPFDELRCNFGKVSSQLLSSKRSSINWMYIQKPVSICNHQWKSVFVDQQCLTCH